LRKIGIKKKCWFIPPVRNPQLVEEVSRNIRSLDLVMVSQIQRSGGTLLSQLLDDHPDLWVFPGELHIAKPKDSWPRLMLWLPSAVLFRQLVDHRCLQYARTGYQKSIHSKETMPFDYDAGLHCAAFCRAMKRIAPRRQREVLDIFFSTFFNSWINHRGRPAPKYLVAFAAGFSIPQTTVEDFFEDYPNGKLISILRDPASWTASALVKNASRGNFATAEQALIQWRRSTEALIRNKKARPDRVLLVTFADLIGRTPETIRIVADFIGIPFEDNLLVPTFNGEHVPSNSSFAAVKGIVDKTVLRHGSDVAIAAGDEELHARALGSCTRPG
jgi:hypothetical protein